MMSLALPSEMDTEFTVLVVLLFGFAGIVQVALFVSSDTHIEIARVPQSLMDDYCLCMVFFILHVYS